MYVAVMGYGVVGSGVASLLNKNHEHILKKSMQSEMELKYILDRRTFPGDPYENLVISDYSKIVEDEEVKIVVETMGGLHPAYEYVVACLKAGKHVVTSNKELVAAKGAELLTIAKEKNVNFFFEASVGGGIPIIKPIHSCLEANEIDEIAGILNGTTNFILTKMIRDGMGFDEALKIAQDLGYAEREPSADVDGHDTCRKICILASLAFGRHVYPESVHTEGIRKVTLEDVNYCDNCDCKIKLIGCAKREADGEVSIGVFPAVIKDDSQLAGVNDVFNAILVRGDATGDVVFYGKGAGKLPTASAVVSDIISAVKADSTSITLTWNDSEQSFIRSFDRFNCANYIRVLAKDKAAAEAVINAEFKGVEYLSRNNMPANEIAFIADVMTESEVEAACAKLSECADILGRIRALDY